MLHFCLPAQRVPSQGRKALPKLSACGLQAVSTSRFWGWALHFTEECCACNDTKDNAGLLEATCRRSVHCCADAISFVVQHALRRVTVHSTAMRKVVWRGCVGLDQMLLACGYLQEVTAPPLIGCLCCKIGIQCQVCLVLLAMPKVLSVS